MTKQQRKNIKRLIIEKLPSIKIGGSLEEEDIFEITRILESEGIISFIAEKRDDGSDYWLQAEYWSNKVNKTIIYDYDYPRCADNLDEAINHAIEIEKQIRKLEAIISVKKTK